jgi:hypothetical protein
MYESDDRNVSHPNHYQGANGIEVIDVIEGFTAGLTGMEAVDTANAIKYILRWKNKNGIQDIEKAIWYLTDLKERLEEKQAREDVKRDWEDSGYLNKT